MTDQAADAIAETFGYTAGTAIDDMTVIAKTDQAADIIAAGRNNGKGAAIGDTAAVVHADQAADQTLGYYFGNRTTADNGAVIGADQAADTRSRGAFYKHIQ